jgi:hypothetical protein
MTGVSPLMRQQKRFDALFPQGAIATWMHQPAQDNVLYQVMWIYVERMEGMDPVLSLYVFGDRILDGLRCTGWKVITPKPNYLAVAQLEHEDPIQLCASVPAGLASRMASYRTQVIEESRYAA